MKGAAATIRRMSSAPSSIDPLALASIRLRVGEVLDEIRPSIQEDGGDVELVDVSAAGEVRVRFKGACVGCPSSGMTLQGGIEKNLRALIPEVTAVTAVE